MRNKYYLGVTDYIVIILTLVVAAAIGIKIRYFGAKQRTTKEYLLAGRNMAATPVILSISVTMVSAVAMVSTPSEVYRYGIQLIMRPVGVAIGMVIATFVFIPVYFQCGVTTVYQFLEMRFGKLTRYGVCAMFMLQSVLYMSVALYAPVLALNAVTDLPIEVSIIVFGSICTFYCLIGGLKAVLWTDSFQFVLMMICLIAIYAAGIIDAGGLTNIYERASRSQRLNVFNFKMDLTTRYTFWNSIFQGIVFGIAGYGTNQVEVQRVLSMGEVNKAKRTLLQSIFPTTALYMLCGIFGLILYAIYYLCDPISNHEESGLTKYDQLVPYFIVSKFQSIPGLTGLCIAGIFSGSLSSISSALNSLSTVTVVDFIQPLIASTRLSETKSVVIAKSFCLMYGIFCMCLAFTLVNTASIRQVNALFASIVDGPTAAIFLIGVLTKKGFGKNVFFGLLAGYCVTSLMSSTIILSRYADPPLPMNTNMCLTTNSSHTLLEDSSACLNFGNCSSVVTPASVPNSGNFALYKMSYMWVRTIGFLITICCIFLAILVTGWKTVDIPSKLLSPVTKFWIKKTEKSECHKDNDIDVEENLLNNLSPTEVPAKHCDPSLY